MTVCATEVVDWQRGDCAAAIQSAHAAGQAMNVIIGSAECASTSLQRVVFTAGCVIARLCVWLTHSYVASGSLIHNTMPCGRSVQMFVAVVSALLSAFKSSTLFPHLTASEERGEIVTHPCNATAWLPSALQAKRLASRAMPFVSSRLVGQAAVTCQLHSVLLSQAPAMAPHTHTHTLLQHPLTCNLDRHLTSINNHIPEKCYCSAAIL